MLRKQISKNKNATVYALDGMLSVVLAIIIIISTNAYLNRNEFNKYKTITPAEIGSDVLNILERTNKLDQFYNSNKEFFNNQLMDNENNMHGNLTNGAKILSENKFQHEIEFDGIDDYVTLPPSNQFLNNDDDFTIIIWFKTNNNVNNMTLFSLHQTANPSLGDVSITIQLIQNTTDERIAFISANQTEWSLNSYPGNFSDNNYHMISLKYDYSDSNLTMNLDLNREFSDNVANIPNFNFDSAFLGTKNSTSGFFDGRINKFLLFNKSLSKTELTNIYNNKTNFYEDDKTNLVANYELKPNIERINSEIENVLPFQYNLTLEIEDENGIKIMTQENKKIGISNKFVAAGERIIAVNDSNVSKILRGKYYAWIQ